HATFLDANCLTAKLQRYLHADPLVLRDPSKVDVQNLEPIGVILEFSNQRAVVRRAGQLYDARAVTNRGGYLISGDRQAHGLLTVTIKDAGHFSAGAQPLGASLAARVARICLKCFSHSFYWASRRVPIPIGTIASCVLHMVYRPRRQAKARRCQHV